MAFLCMFGQIAQKGLGMCAGKQPCTGIENTKQLAALFPWSNFFLARGSLNYFKFTACASKASLGRC
jgi:hypothetical protein